MSILGFVLKPLAYFGLPAFLLHQLSNNNPVARYYIRLALYVSTLSICSAGGVIASFFLSAVGQRFNVNWVIARSFYGLAGYVLDIHFVVEGEEHLETRPAVLVGNHQSMIDILYLGRIFPKRASIMAKKELQWMPFLGQFLAASGAVFVDRGNNAKAIRSLAAAGETMRSRGTSLWLFPEGTRSMRPYHDLLPFKKGAFHLAVQAGVPVIPVVCENYWRLYRTNVFESGTLRIRVLPPIPTEGLTTADVQELAERVHEQMVAALREISDPNAPPHPNSQAQSKSAPISLPAEKQADVTAPSDPEPVSAATSETSASDGKVLTTPATPASEAMSLSEESAYRGSETEEDEGMVLVGRP